MLTDDYHRPIGMNLTDWKLDQPNNTGFSKEKMGPTAKCKTTITKIRKKTIKCR